MLGVGAGQIESFAVRVRGVGVPPQPAQEVCAGRVQEVVIAQLARRSELVDEREAPSGPVAIPTATAWFSLMNGFVVTSRSRVYRAAIRGQSVVPGVWRVGVASSDESLHLVGADRVLADGRRT